MIHKFSIGLGADGEGAAVSVVALGEGSWRVTVAETSRVWNARRVVAGKKHATYSLHEDGGGAHHLVDVDGVLPDLTVSSGEPVRLTFPVKVGDARSQMAALATPRGASGPQQLRSPMPGKVVKVLVKVGDEVKAGAPVIVVEAMKMENELRAARDGVVKEIPVTEGQAVESGHVVAVLG